MRDPPATYQFRVVCRPPAAPVSREVGASTGRNISQERRAAGTDHGVAANAANVHKGSVRFPRKDRAFYSKSAHACYVPDNGGGCIACCIADRRHKRHDVGRNCPFERRRGVGWNVRPSRKGETGMPTTCVNCDRWDDRATMGIRMDLQDIPKFPG